MSQVFELRLAAGPSGFHAAVDSLSTFVDHSITASSDTVIDDETYGFLVDCLTSRDVRPMYLWMINATLEIRSPSHWWKQAETYFPDIQWVRHDDGESPRVLTQSNFEEPIPTGVLDLLNEYVEKKDRDAIRRLLPDSFVSRAYVQTTYLTLRTSYQERVQYRTGHWRRYCDSLADLPYNRLITEDNRGDVQTAH